ncbi:MAG: VWA domain-containing protein [Planctomycetaceae bacterium]|jgi:hypothetical protein|nr:VWA domain-containing protein [Planctomycetaceae bacterium]
MDSLLISLSRRAWVGSLLFHLFLFGILIFLMRLQPIHKTLPHERNASGGILIKQADGEIVQYIDAGNEVISAADEIKSEDAIIDDKSLEFTPLQSPPRIGLGNKSTNSKVNLFTNNLPNSLTTSSNTGIHAGENSGGNTIQLRVFDVAAKGNNFVFVFDKSDSMNERGGIPFKEAKSELLRNIRELGNNEKSRFNIIFYNDELHQWSNRGMLEAVESNCRSAAQFVQFENARGGTKHFEPLVAALKQKPDVIFFLTDGDDNDAMTQIQLNEIKRINQMNKVRINVIQFGVGKYRTSEFLKQLADDNNGQYSYINVTEF